MVFMRFPGGRQRAVTLSYDDGVRQDKKLIEIMDKYGVKGTFNINSGCTGKEEDADKPSGRMSWKEMKDLYVDHEVALHGLTHPFLERLPEANALYEVAKDRENIEREFGKIVRGMAYPYGTYNNTVIEILEKCGIAYSRTTQSTHAFGFPERWCALHPTCHHRDAKVFELIDKFFAESNFASPMMFYLWGHAYEFDFNEPNNNWEHAEKVVQALSGHENVWYATNIEIYDYVKCYENLVFSMDTSRVYNPNAIDVCFAVGGGNNVREFCVKPGEALEIK